MKHFGDITKIHGADVPPVDAVIGGSPCQGLSIAIPPWTIRPAPSEPVHGQRTSDNGESV